MADGQRAVVVGLLAQLVRHKLLPPDPTHCSQNRGRELAPTADLVIHHRRPAGGKIGRVHSVHLMQRGEIPAYPCPDALPLTPVNIQTDPPTEGFTPGCHIACHPGPQAKLLLLSRAGKD